MEGNRQKTERTCYPRVESGAQERGIALRACGPMDRCRGELLFVGEQQSPHKKCFHFPRETFLHALSSYGYMYSFSSELCTKCKWRCTPNHGSPRLPPVSNAYGAK